jgi:hypothetical protein
MPMCDDEWATIVNRILDSTETIAVKGKVRKPIREVLAHAQLVLDAESALVLSQLRAKAAETTNREIRTLNIEPGTGKALFPPGTDSHSLANLGLVEQRGYPHQPFFDVVRYAYETSKHWERTLSKERDKIVSQARNLMTCISASPEFNLPVSKIRLAFGKNKPAIVELSEGFNPFSDILIGELMNQYADVISKVDYEPYIKRRNKERKDGHYVPPRVTVFIRCFCDSMGAKNCNMVPRLTKTQWRDVVRCLCLVLFADLLPNNDLDEETVWKNISRFDFP